MPPLDESQQIAFERGRKRLVITICPDGSSLVQLGAEGMTLSFGETHQLLKWAGAIPS